jgi:hypothetical protein
MATDAKLFLYDRDTESRYLLTQSLAKYAKDADIYVCCTHPEPYIIPAFCWTVLELIENAFDFYHKNMMDYFLLRIKTTLEDPMYSTNPNYENDILLYEIAKQVKKCISDNTLLPEINVLLPPKDTQLCSFCGATSTDVKKCSGCRSVYYCGKECQHSDWKSSHKAMCNICSTNYNFLKKN